ncbi:MAG: YqgE/AlgH family protein [Paracoccaceae bacterium]
MDLTGKLLVAMPGMGDPRFEKAVILVCAHSADESMGLIINKPAPGVDVDDLLEQMNIPRATEGRAIRVHFGGPVEHGRGFVLHSSDYAANDTTLRVGDLFGMTATLDVLEQLAKGQGPTSALLMLGYSGWGPGQLEEEILRNGWLTCDATPELVFARDSSTKWGNALHSLGVDPTGLSAAAGRA